MITQKHYINTNVDCEKWTLGGMGYNIILLINYTINVFVMAWTGNVLYFERE